MKQEYVAVVKDDYREAFRDAVFVPDELAGKRLNDIELCLESEFRKREAVEGNKLYLQLVSYTFLINPKRRKIFVARRTGGDKRLNDLNCIGFGGHVEMADFRIEDDESPNPVLKAAIRELREELRLKQKTLRLRHIGFVRDLSSNTSEHLGSVFYLETASASILEKDKLAGARWVDYDEFKLKYYPGLESWSKAIFDYIYDSPVYSKLFGFQMPATEGVLKNASS